MTVPAGRESRLSLGQAVATLVAVVSLVFVGMEVRQNTKAIRGGTYQAVAESNADWLRLLVTRPELGELLQRWTAGDTALTEEEVGRARGLQLYFWRTVENAHYQHRQGNLPEAVVRRWIPPNLFENEVLAEWWSESQDRFTPEFVEYVESVGVAEPTNP